MSRNIRILSPLALGLCLSLNACEDKSATPLAPSASALAPAEKPTATAQALEVQTQGSKVEFLMDAPLEKIHGEAPDSVTGELFIDPSNIGKTTGLIKVDLDKLTLYQQKRDNEEAEYGERVKSDKQNEHARAWLEIGEDAPKDKREQNRWAEFKIDEIKTPSATDVSKLTGAERKVTGMALGEFRLHGRKTQKRAPIEATFHYAGDKLEKVTVKTTAPMAVGLDEHDVRPREAFGKLAKATLDSVGSKVASEAPIQIELTAKPK